MGQINTHRQGWVPAWPGLSGQSLEGSPTSLRAPLQQRGGCEQGRVRAGTQLTDDVEREVVVAADEAGGAAGAAVVEPVVVGAGARHGQRPLLVADRVGAAAIREGAAIPKPLPRGAARQGRAGEQGHGTTRAAPRAGVQSRQPRDGPFPWLSVPAAAGPDTDTKP